MNRVLEEGAGDPPPAREKPAGRSVNALTIASVLRREIVEGVYAYRDRLPAERLLAERFSAARGTVRSALQHLEKARLLSREPGRGAFVSYRGLAPQEDIAELTSPLELIDVRIAVEPDMARLAVRHANAQDLKRMREALERVEGCDGDAEIFSRADEAYHLCLAECTRNPLMLWLYRHINQVRRHTQWDMRKDKILTRDAIAGYNRQHRELYDAIVARDADSAAQILIEHLRQARTDLLGAHP
ncbi:MAG TPA: FCD domain-containing protein [Gammaproteobacteria bacterium]|nr:FCD domain-containing protein [Gammaproteobacteria bacterium]